MDNKIGHIVNWFLTRKCNLKCSYCSLIKQSDVYENTAFKEDVDLDKAKEFILRLNKHNKNSFHIFYGGEPTIYKNFYELLDFCNKNKILYTITTNLTGRSFKKIKEIIQKLGYLNGLSFTVDSVLWDPNSDKNDDRYKKSKNAYENFIKLKKFKKNIKEFVALVCSDNNNIKYLETICKDLNKKGIWANIVFIERKRNKYYDFCSELPKELLVQKTNENINIIKDIYDKCKKKEIKLIGHQILKDYVINNLPENYICKLDKNLSTITIDSDTKFRLCARIKGFESQKIDILDILDKNGNLTNKYYEQLKNMKIDKDNYCVGCFWNCPMFSEFIHDNLIDSSEINHNQM